MTWSLIIDHMISIYNIYIPSNNVGRGGTQRSVYFSLRRLLVCHHNNDDDNEKKKKEGRRRRKRRHKNTT